MKKRAAKSLAILLGVIAAIMWVMFSKIMENVVNIILNDEFRSFIMVVAFFVAYILITRMLFYLAKYFKIIYINKAIEELKAAYLEKMYAKNRINGSADILATLTNDMQIIKQYFYDNGVKIICDVVTFILSSYLMLKISVTITLILYLLIILMIILPFVFKQQIEMVQNELSQRNKAYVNIVKDQFTGFNVLKDHGVIEHFKPQQSIANKQVTMAYIHFEKINTLFEELSHFVITIIGSVGFLLGSYYVLLGKVNYGQMIALVQLTNTLTSPVSSLMSNVAGYLSAKKLYTTIKQTVDEQTHESINEPLELADITSLQLVDVSFSLEDKVILDHVDLTFEKGKKYLILGETGSGKSTILKLVMNYQQNYQGKILLNDVDVRNVEISQLARYINYVSQDKYLFLTSIKDNISLYRDSDNNVEDLIEMTHLDKLIQSNKAGLDMLIRENQDNISGGEKERICLCRALYVPKDIFLADEITSALDAKTAGYIDDIILNLDAKIVINVSHKIADASLQRYDEIILMQKGKVAFKGSYENYVKYLNISTNDNQ
ncbi:MAG: ABC transporter ATP-binding protein/permease [Erysipelotrichaceae bacterium]|nr:ABC transporter ATP-binding protein/permease [Erysipelotrichaceae bacterium]MDY5251929.1 ABC transporter ATP-binding protein [Erysipelotrichaceae bacterium]